MRECEDSDTRSSWPSSYLPSLTAPLQPLLLLFFEFIIFEKDCRAISSCISCHPVSACTAWQSTVYDGEHSYVIREESEGMLCYLSQSVS